MDQNGNKSSLCDVCQIVEIRVGKRMPTYVGKCCRKLATIIATYIGTYSHS